MTAHKKFTNFVSKKKRFVKEKMVNKGIKAESTRVMEQVIFQEVKLTGR